VIELTLKEDLLNKQAAILDAILNGKTDQFAALIQEQKVLSQGEKDILAFNLFLYGYSLRNDGNYADLLRLQEFLSLFGYPEQANQLFDNIEPYTPPQPTAIPFVALAPLQQIAEQAQVAEQAAAQQQALPEPNINTDTQFQGYQGYVPGTSYYLSIPVEKTNKEEIRSGAPQNEVKPLIIIANPTIRIPISTVSNTNMQSSFSAQGEMTNFALDKGLWIELSLAEVIKLAAEFFSVTEMTVTNSSPDGNGGYNLTLKNSALPFNLNAWSNHDLKDGT